MNGSHGNWITYTTWNIVGFILCFHVFIFHMDNCVTGSDFILFSVSPHAHVTITMVMMTCAIFWICAQVQPRVCPFHPTASRHHTHKSSWCSGTTLLTWLLYHTPIWKITSFDLKSTTLAKERYVLLAKVPWSSTFLDNLQ